MYVSTVNPMMVAAAAASAASSAAVEEEEEEEEDDEFHETSSHHAGYASSVTSAVDLADHDEVDEQPPATFRSTVSVDGAL